MKAAEQAGTSGWDWTGTLCPQTPSPQRFHLIRHSTKHISYSMPHDKDLRIELVSEMPKYHHSRADPNRVGRPITHQLHLCKEKIQGRPRGGRTNGKEA